MFVNYTIESHLENIRRVARSLRRDAAILVERAKQIEEEADHLKVTLQEAVVDG